VWQFEFVYCPKVPENSSVAHQPSCIGVGFSLYWLTGGLFLCLAPFLWGKFRDLSAGSLLSACCDGLLIVFQFCSIIWLWILLTCSGDKLCRLLPALFQAAAYHPPLSALLPFQPLFIESLHGDQLLASPLFSSVLTAPCPLFCAFLFSSLFIIQGFFFVGWWVSLSRGLCWFIPVVAMGILRDAWCSPVFCWMSPKQVWSWCLVAWEPYSFLI
jgi:hypothetical protein